MRHGTGDAGPGKAVGFGLAERERLPGRARRRQPGSGARRARFPNGTSRKVVAKMRHLLGFVLAVAAAAALFFGARLLNAVSHLGVRHIDMPMTPERVWTAIQKASTL